MIVSQLLFTQKDMALLKMTDVYSLHRVVYDCFPLDEEDTGRGRGASFLYVDNGMRNGQRQVVVLSQTPPKTPRQGKLESKPLPESLLEHKSYRFWLTLNPVKRESASRKIVPIKGQEAIRQWFCAKAPSWGFSINSECLEIIEHGVWEFMKKEVPVTLAFARLSGSLRVNDLERFSESFCKGIGRGKAFGLGMLQIIPLV